MKLILTRGLPASGKSTWAREWVLQEPKERVRICRDDIRRMLGKYWVPQREDLVTKIERESVLYALRAGYDVVVDATNFSKIERWYDIKKLLGLFDLEVEVMDFTHVRLDECIARDSQRKGTEKVGEDAIKRMYNKYLDN